MATVPEALVIAVQHHQGGRLQVAEQIYRQILAVDPNHADAIHLLGVIALQLGKHDIAIQQIGQAIAIQGDVAFYHNNLGEALRAMRRNSEAAASYRRALELMPNYAEAHNNLGNALEDIGQTVDAIECYRMALQLNPDFAVAHRNLGIALWEQGQRDEAIACCRRAVALQPNYAEAHYNLGNMAGSQGKLDDAVACYRQALELKPNFAMAHNNLGNVLRDQSNVDDAVLSYRRALEHQPDFAMAHSNLGNALKDRGNLAEAVACYRRALSLQPDFAVAHSNLAVALKELGNPDEAVICYRRALELKPDYAEGHNNLGNLLRDQGNLDEALLCYHRALDLQPSFAVAHNNLAVALKDQGKLDEAIACYRRALELKPDYAHAYSNLGIIYEEMGDLQNAEECFRAALQRDPHFAMAHYKLAELLGSRLPEEDFAEQRRLLELPAGTDVNSCADVQVSISAMHRHLSDEQRLLLHFGVAKVLDGRGDYAGAAAHLDQGNALQLAQWNKRGQRYIPAEHEWFVSRMISTCTSDFFERVDGFGIATELPVFVVGLPRSGTTLVEQILASHSQVYGAGELKLAGAAMSSLGGPGLSTGTDPFENLGRLDRQGVQHLASRYMERFRPLHPTALRIISKMPENYLFLGLLATLVPHAKFIHCRRDLRDVAVSCWMTHFAETRWANDRRHIALRFEQYLRLMEHWRKVLPVPMLEVDYEQTVADPEGTARKLVDWCGLEWEPGCLEFYRNKRVVRTASAVQVRQPIYRGSVERWKHYEGALGSLFAELESMMHGSSATGERQALAFNASCG